MNNYIKSDVYRVYGKADLLTIIKAFIKDRTLRFQIILRMRQSDGFVRFIGGALWVFNKTKQDIKIRPETKIGYGLYIGHGGPVVINPTAIIGNNCNLSQFSTIGTNENHAATIGNNVYIGPNVCIVENVLIGDNVTIGAGSIVTKNVPKNATVVGNYAKIINYDSPGKYIQNPWNDSI